MIKGSFGLKLFSDRDILLVENHRLVHYGKGTRGKSTYNEKTQIYFFIQDKYLCQEINDPYYVIEVIELSTIPIYHFSDTVISNNINSHKSAERRKDLSVGIYYRIENEEIQFSVCFRYKNRIYEEKINKTVLALLKYTWLHTQTLSLDNYKFLGDKIYSKVLNTDIGYLLSNLKIIRGEKLDRDREPFGYAERYIINSDDYFIIHSLLTLSEKFYPRRFNDSTYYMYGNNHSDDFTFLSEYDIDLESKLKYLEEFIDLFSKKNDKKESIKYIILQNNLLNKKHSSKSSMLCGKLCNEVFDKAKTNKIKNAFLRKYKRSDHISSLFYLMNQSILIPDLILNNLIIDYNNWKIKYIKESGLRHLTIYWSAKEICKEFNERCNNRFNFHIDFSQLAPLQFDISDFNWEEWANS